MAGTEREALHQRPLIGVTPRWFPGQDVFCAGESVGDVFMDALIDAGAMPMMLPITSDVGLIKSYVDLCDGFSFTGGHNVNPSLWGEPLTVANQLCHERDSFEIPLMEAILEADKPFLGICRGMQMLNVVLGGSLVQDLTTLEPQGRDALWTHGIILDRAAHPVHVEEGSLLYDIVHAHTVEVNSSHMQCLKRLGAGVRVAARATDGIIEAIEVPSKRFCLGVQWHPEYTWRTFAHDARLYRRLVAAACS